MVEGTIKVLLVEDNPGDVRLVQEELSGGMDTFFDVVTASTLQDAISSIEKNIVDVILLDLGLPDSSGLDTFLKVREKAINIPVIILSGNKDESLATIAKSKGAEDYLMKGEIDSKYVRKFIFNAIEKHNIIKELEKTKEELEKYKQMLEQGTNLPL